MSAKSASIKNSKSRIASQTEQVIPRLPIVDLARGIALFVMAAFHFSWDLTWFELVTWPVTEATGWNLFRISIASSFLFLTGVSLTLAHGNGLRFQPFIKRFIIITLCAATISLVTWYMFPNEMVRFGILHCIAFSSIAGLIFLRIPKLVSLISATIIAFFPLFVEFSYLDNPNLTWIGLGTTKPETVDYVPIFPWFAVPLYGIVFTRFAIEKNWHLMLADLKLQNRIFKSLRLFGKHSLLFYMAHQPILLGTIWLALFLGIGQAAQTEVKFHNSCLVDCNEIQSDVTSCPQFCDCVISQLQLENTWNQVVSDIKNPNNIAIISESFQSCNKIN